MVSSRLSLTSLEIGGGAVETIGESGYRFRIPATTRYADAQVDDCQRLPRRRFLWREDFSMTLTALASHASPAGTLGFGLWNDPFTLSLGQGGAARRLPSPPRAIWFFYCSEPSELAAAEGAPPNGWKAVCLETQAVPSLLLAPAAAAAVALAQIRPFRGPILRRALRATRASEASLSSPLDEAHEYSLQRGHRSATFRVDGRVVLEAPAPPPGPLGFVAWIDNQYAVISPERGLGFGVVPTQEEQWLELRNLQLRGG